MGRGRREGGERGWGGDVGERGRVGKGEGEGEREREREREGRGEEGRGGERRGEEGRGGEGRGGEGRGGEGRGGVTVIHIVIGMVTSNPMIPQYLNNILT